MKKKKTIAIIKIKIITITTDSLSAKSSNINSENDLTITSKIADINLDDSIIYGKKS